MYGAGIFDPKAFITGSRISGTKEIGADITGDGVFFAGGGGGTAFLTSFVSKVGLGRAGRTEDLVDLTVPLTVPKSHPCSELSIRSSKSLSLGVYSTLRCFPRLSWQIGLLTKYYVELRVLLKVHFVLRLLVMGLIYLKIVKKIIIPLIKPCFNNSFAVGRLFGSFSKQAATKLLNNLEKFPSKIGGSFFGIRNKALIGCISE